MAKSRADCLEELIAKTGRKREQVEDELNDIFERSQRYEHEDGLSPDQAYAKARDEKLAELGESQALRRREEILNTRKAAALNRFYDTSLAAIKALPVSPRLAGKLSRQAASLALEAKLVGINLPIFKNRLSVDAQYVALRRLWVGGLARDLEQAGLLKAFASRHLEENWTRELFELNRGRDGFPGVSKDKQALAIAQVIRKWQRQGMIGINREGGWVRSYSGFVTKTSHDPDRIRLAGVTQWTGDVLPLLNLRKTFGPASRQDALDALHAMYDPLVKGDHYDYGKPVEEPLYANLASKASAHRELHFKDGKAWLAYNRKYGSSDPTETVVRSLALAARRTALMKEFGTRPREMFETFVNGTKAKLQQEAQGHLSKLSALQAARESPSADKATQAEIDGKIAALTPKIEEAQQRFEDFQRFTGRDRFFGSPADNRFAQIDGAAHRPVNRTRANVVAGWMAVQRMSKLGRVALTHFASLPTKVAEAHYWGIGLAERYGSLLRGLTHGAEGSAKREALDNTLVHFENRLGHMMAMYDVADAPHGALAKAESTFFKLTGVSAVTDNQRGDAEAMFAAHLGRKRDLSFADVGRKEQRVLAGFGLGEAEWELLRQAKWSKVGERTFLFPSDALKLSDEAVKGYLAGKADVGFGKFNPPAEADLDKARQDLALALAAAYSDRAGYAVPLPSARIRAMLFQNAFEPGTPLNTALRLVYQFKLWPADMIVRSWGRELYGRIGDGKLDRVAGLVEFLVGSAVFGTASEAVREAIQGRDGYHELLHNPFGSLVRGLQRSGFGSLLGDFLLGEYDRHGFTPLQQLAGPTIPEIDLLVDMLWAGETGKRHGTLSAQAWRTRASDALAMARNNTPFMNLWSTGWAINTLVWHRLQEWINPGYLRRAEQRQKSQSGIDYLVSPAKTDQWITGRAASPF